MQRERTRGGSRTREAVIARLNGSGHAYMAVNFGHVLLNTRRGCVVFVSAVPEHRSSHFFNFFGEREKPRHSQQQIGAKVKSKSRNIGNGCDSKL